MIGRAKTLVYHQDTRVVLSQFIEKAKQKMMLISVNTRKRDSKKAEVKGKCFKKVKVEESQTDCGSSHISTNEAHTSYNLLEIAGKIRKQIAKWKNSQKETFLKQLKEHTDFEIKVRSTAGSAGSDSTVDVSISYKTCNTSSSLGTHNKPNSFVISNWTCHVKNCKVKMEKEKCNDQKTLTNFLKPQTSDYKEMKVAQSKNADVLTNVNDTTVEVKDSENNTNDNQKVFWLSPSYCSTMGGIQLMILQ